jgi:hypothetical protein
MYIGKTDRGLRARFREYLREANNPAGRIPVRALITMYRDYLKFYFAPLDPSISPYDVEQELIKLFVPPANRQIPAVIGDIARAW